jgi:alpha-L-rhamnosidase
VRIYRVAIVVLAFLLSLHLFAAVAAGQAGAGGGGADGSLVAESLRCEYLVDPLGIDAVGARAPRLSWTLGTVKPGLRGRAQTGYQIMAAESLKALGKEVGAGGGGLLWDSGRVASDQMNQLVYGGKGLVARGRVYWKVRVWDNEEKVSAWSKPAVWSMGLLKGEDWGGAEWIGDPGEAPAGQEALPAVMLRKRFLAAAAAEQTPVTRATMYATALGLYEVCLNGRRVGDRVLAPEWTDYNKRVQYQTYDVTELVLGGKDNVLAAVVGDGWYAGRIGLSHIVKDGPKRGIYGRKTRLRLRLDVEYADGTTQTVVSDGTWKCTTEGPLRVADMLDGVVYDAQREMTGWEVSGYRPSEGQDWKAVKVYEQVRAALVAQPNEPVRLTRALKPVSVTEPKPGVFVFDLGQNMVGCCRLALPAGTAGAAGEGVTITLRHAEVLNPDGMLFTANLRSAGATDRYTAKGTGAETFVAPFTYHGFRYVEVTGLSSKPTAELITGLVFHSAPTEVGSFECSSALANKLMQNVLWTQRGNMESVPTDCPQRDERLGWMGDILAFAPAACFNMDMAAFLTKWIPDVRDAQAADGRFGDFSPHPYDPNVRFSGTPAWGDAGVVVPWVAYQTYGDRRLLEEHYEAAKRWVEYIRANNPDLVWRKGRGNSYGDWLTADTFKIEGLPKKGADTPQDVFATLFFYRSADLLSKMAGVLGRDADAKSYSELAAGIRAAFNAAFVGPDGTIQGYTQGSYALALQFGLVPEELRAKAAQHMVDGFESYHGSLSTGFHATGPLMLQLVENGYLADAYRLLNNRTMPSWGYLIDHGATTIWERWDGHVEGRGFQDAGMNSFSHYAFGAVAEWMYRTILGINGDPEAPGYQRFTIRPRPGGGLTWAKGSYESIRGRIGSDWRLEDGRLTLSVEVPVNTTATVYVPADDANAVTEGGKEAARAPGVQFVRAESGAAVYKVGSGRYTFQSTYRPAPTP